MAWLSSVSFTRRLLSFYLYTQVIEFRVLLLIEEVNTCEEDLVGGKFFSTFDIPSIEGDCTTRRVKR